MTRKGKRGEQYNHHQTKIKKFEWGNKVNQGRLKRNFLMNMEIINDNPIMESNQEEKSWTSLKVKYCSQS